MEAGRVHIIKTVFAGRQTTRGGSPQNERFLGLEMQSPYGHAMRLCARARAEGASASAEIRMPCVVIRQFAVNSRLRDVTADNRATGDWTGRLIASPRYDQKVAGRHVCPYFLRKW